jgi:hypothetical protein
MVPIDESPCLIRCSRLSLEVVHQALTAQTPGTIVQNHVALGGERFRLQLDLDSLRLQSETLIVEFDRPCRHHEILTLVLQGAGSSHRLSATLLGWEWHLEGDALGRGFNLVL